MLKGAGLNCVERGVAIEFRHGLKHVQPVISSLAKQWPQSELIARQVEPKQRRKFDRWLGEELLTLTIALDLLDVSSAVMVCAARSEFDN